MISTASSDRRSTSGEVGRPLRRRHLPPRHPAGLRRGLASPRALGEASGPGQAGHALGDSCRVEGSAEGTPLAPPPAAPQRRHLHPQGVRGGDGADHPRQSLGSHGRVVCRGRRGEGQRGGPEDRIAHASGLAGRSAPATWARRPRDPGMPQRSEIFIAVGCRRRPTRVTPKEVMLSRVVRTPCPSMACLLEAGDMKRPEREKTVGSPRAELCDGRDAGHGRALEFRRNARDSRHARGIAVARTSLGYRSMAVSELSAKVGQRQASYRKPQLKVRVAAVPSARGRVPAGDLQGDDPLRQLGFLSTGGICSPCSGKWISSWQRAHIGGDRFAMPMEAPSAHCGVRSLLACQRPMSPGLVSPEQRQHPHPLREPRRHAQGQHRQRRHPDRLPVLHRADQLRLPRHRQSQEPGVRTRRRHEVRPGERRPRRQR